MHDFQEFMKQRSAAAEAYVSGDAAPLGALTSRTDPATFFGPMGDYCQGGQEVWARYERDAASFAPGSTSTFEILHMAASDGLAYLVGFQRAMANMHGQDQSIPFNLRVTELFRREADTWKLIHRHADVLTAE